MPKLPNDVAAKLRMPFNPEDISWKPQTVDYKAKTALAVAYADPRAYIDRFNEVFGVGGWEDDYSFIATPFTKVIKGKSAWGDKPATEDKVYPGNKIVVVCKLIIHGFGDPIRISSTGDSDASDDNAATSAEAQAFKRAAMKLGLGRYLYELPKQTARYDRGSWLDGPPTLPDWAMPKYSCEECNSEITSVTHGTQVFSVAQLKANSQKKYQKDLCGTCQRKRAEEAKIQLGRPIA